MTSPSALLAGLALLCSAASLHAEPGVVVVDRIAVVVNGEIILGSEVDRRKTQYAAQVDQITDAAQKLAAKASMAKDVVDSLIDEAILLGMARDVSISVDDAEADAAIGEIKSQNKLDDAKLTAELAKQGFTMAEYREEVRKQLVLFRAQKLLVDNRVLVSDDEVKAEYDREQKAGAKLGELAAERERIGSSLYQFRVAQYVKQWLADQKSRAYVDVRVQP